MDIKAEVKWIEAALLDSKDPTFVTAVKNLIHSLSEVRTKTKLEISDLHIKEVETDINEGRTYNQKESLQIVADWDIWQK